MIIEKISPNNREKAMALVLSVFMRYEMPDYSEQGIQTFRDFINNKESPKAQGIKSRLILLRTRSRFIKN
ncbi:hypothetical protein [Desulfitobacterium hafniense]|uniref:hypothetical protein n=1 Tax=Desulfitobacterium hafniense TaxID=49338 RepID=UPI00036F7848|nr:hypothetical protein [Desulfitobacterium hafniense]